MKKICIGVIGCGRIANNAHFPALAKIGEVRVKYACDLIPEKALAAKEKYPFIEHAVTDYQTVLRDGEVEAVWVLTPNFAHYTITMEALAAGKHVFCEKPITVNYPLSLKMAQKAEECGKILNIGVCNRFFAPVEKLAQMIADGRFGKVYHVNCSFCEFRSIPGLGGAFTTKAQSGGGVLIDWGVHFFDLILYLLGGAKVQSVSGASYSEMAKDLTAYRYKKMWAEDTADLLHGTNDVEDYITGFVRTDKASISFNGAWAENLDRKQMYVDILGDKGGARYEHLKGFTFTDGATLESQTPEMESENMYLCEDRAFLESVRTGMKNKSHISEVLETAKLLDAIYRSADIGKEVTLG